MDLIEYMKTGGKDFIRHPWEQARLNMLLFFLRRFNSQKTILDIGSGDAYLASGIAIEYPSSKIIAVDINYSDEILSSLNKTKPINLVFEKTLLRLQNEKSIDIVILMDILEHIEYPELLLKQILQLEGITKKTNFIITVPAYQKLFSQHDVNLEHFKRYDRRQLLGLIQPLSFKSVKDGYCFISLVIMRFFHILIKKRKNKEQNAENSIYNWRGGKIVTNFLRIVLWIEFKISWYLSRIGIKLPGLTFYCICQPFQ